MSSSPDGPKISLLQQREIEARIVGPLLCAFREELGEERTLQIVRSVITDLARQSGADLARLFGEATLDAFARHARPLAGRSGTPEIRCSNSRPARLSFNVTRCRYAEMYRALGLADLGANLSCSRDAALVEGFNPLIRLTRTQTLMQGATHCDFRFAAFESRLRASEPGETNAFSLKTFPGGGGSTFPQAGQDGFVFEIREGRPTRYLRPENELHLQVAWTI